MISKRKLPDRTQALQRSAFRLSLFIIQSSFLWGNPIGGPNVKLPDVYERERVYFRVNNGKSAIRDADGATEGNDSAHIFNSTSSLLSDFGGGVKIIQRHIKTGPEGPWWPVYDDGKNIQYSRSSSPSYFHKGENLVLDMKAEADAHGQTTFFYYRHTGEDYYAGKGSDVSPRNKIVDAGTYVPGGKFPGRVSPWVCLNKSGEIQMTTRGIWLCINSPYRDIVRDRINYLSANGIGNHFDYYHNPQDGCFCEYCKNKWVRDGWGSESDFLNQSEGGAKIVDFYNASVKDYFMHLMQGSRQVNPTFMIGMKTASLSRLWFRGIRSSSAAIADVIMLEYGQAEDRNFWRYWADQKGEPLYQPNRSYKLAFTWSCMRDLSYGRPPKLAITDLFRGDLKGPDEILALTGAGLVFGLSCVMVIQSDDYKLINLDSYEAIQLAGNYLAPHIGYTRPYHWLGILYPEFALDKRNWNQNLKSKVTLSVAREILSPMFAIAELMNEEGLPYGFLSQEQLLNTSVANAEQKYLDQFKIIVCPVPESEIPETYKSGLDDFISRGGKIYYLNGATRGGDRWDGYSGNDVRNQLKESFRNTLTNDDQIPTIRVDKSSGSDGSAVFHAYLKKMDDAPENPGQFIIMLTRPWAWATEPEPTRPYSNSSAENYKIILNGPVAGTTFEHMDIRTGIKSKLQAIKSGSNKYTLSVPAFDQMTAVIISPPGSAAIER